MPKAEEKFFGDPQIPYQSIPKQSWIYKLKQSQVKGKSYPQFTKGNYTSGIKGLGRYGEYLKSLEFCEFNNMFKRWCLQS